MAVSSIGALSCKMTIEDLGSVFGQIDPGKYGKQKSKIEQDNCYEVLACSWSVLCCDRREPFTVDEREKRTAGRPAVGLDVTLTWVTHVPMWEVVGKYVFGGFSAR